MNKASSDFADVSDFSALFTVCTNTAFFCLLLEEKGAAFIAASTFFTRYDIVIITPGLTSGSPEQLP